MADVHKVVTTGLMLSHSLQEVGNKRMAGPVKTTVPDLVPVPVSIQTHMANPAVATVAAEVEVALPVALEMVSGEMESTFLALQILVLNVNFSAYRTTRRSSILA